jgi:retinoid hydroxylase
MAPVASPPPLRAMNPLLAIVKDLQAERAAEVPFPPGDTDFSMGRTRRFTEDPLPLLLEAYERYGPVFTLRLFHGNVVFMLGPAANHYVTVSHATNFQWRESHFRDLISFLGDGLLTTDGAYHRRSRTVMLPAFHRERIAASIGVMLEETEAALERLAPDGVLRAPGAGLRTPGGGLRTHRGTTGATVDLYAWTRALALRIAMRALFGLDPDGAQARAVDAAGLFEQALGFYATPVPLRMLRGPGTPWRRQAQATRALNRVLYAEIARRRTTGERGEDVLSLLLDAHDEQGEGLTDGQIRDEVMTLLFAGHDTTTSTVAFMFYELAHHPEVVARLVAEQDTVLAGAPPTAEQLMSGELAELEQVLDETLRMYPPAWIGPRRSLEAFEFQGVPVPGDTFVNYCSWASHHLPEVFPEPERFHPERFAPEEKARMEKGAYIPFGGGSRTCIGMRFGQLEVRTIATLLLQRCSLRLPEDFKLSIRQMPTISPRRGMPMMVGPRPSVPAAPVASAS